MKYFFLSTITVMMVLTVSGCATTTTETNSTAIDPNQPKITFGKLHDCTVTSLPDREKSTLIEFWVKNNKTLSGKTYPIVISYDIPQGYVVGSGLFRRDGELTGTSFSLALEGKADNVTIMSKGGDLDFIDASTGNEYDSVFSFNYGVRATQNLLPGQNSITITIPIQDWEIVQEKADGDIAVPESNIISEGAITTTCRF